ncbi:hypothetical protein B0675_06760 [Streptomyces sp. M41(2017)]|uniref:hypothetical protein n=1 Tax=Streptomyces sp. M41(2017) TaxID=1955065 RepID=UPI0009BFA550|nr:hypothetical protein [Streptomyces sp. M41(2017)]OQQ20225.1 hypothetical protein B0675_06760 [Streptomyces sp. M41(2017)]
MYTRGRTLRFTAVSVMVVLALTGFSTGRHGSRSHHSSGGGCSSSRQDHDSSSSTSTSGGGSYGGGSSSSDPYGGSSSDPYGGSSDDAYGSGTGTSGGTYRSRPTHRSTATATSSGTSRPLKDGTAVLKRCASTDDDPYTTAEVRNPNGREAVFTVNITYKDASGSTLAESGDQVTVPANGKATVRVAVASTGAVDRLDHCVVDRRATVDR